MGGIDFISGAYGVGKSYLCERLAALLDIRAFSASDLISEDVGEEYGANKFVKDKDLNQRALIESAAKLIKQLGNFLLTGHFCIFNHDNMVERLPDYVFYELPIRGIVLLEADPEYIISNLNRRDKKKYSMSNICELIEQEHRYATHISQAIKCPMLIHKMTFTDADVQKVSEFLKERNNVK